MRQTTVTEQNLIHYLASQAGKREDVELGIGDDAALLISPPHQRLVITTDTLNVGIHFPATTPAADVGYKSLAVNLSDLAAMGAEPAWALLSLTLPEASENWLKAFSRGFFELMKQFNLQLVGGDTNRGTALSITVQAIGFVPSDCVLTRGNAQVGDFIYVTGTLGDAGFALKKLSSVSKIMLRRLNRPTPRVGAGLKLRNIAHAAIDLSDGLVKDLSHILQASQVGATIWLEDLPLSAELRRELPLNQAWQFALSAGDDYELCFTAPPSAEQQLEAAFKKLDCHYTCIGKIEQRLGLRLQSKQNLSFKLETTGYEHFRTSSPSKK